MKAQRTLRAQRALKAQRTLKVQRDSLGVPILTLILVLVPRLGLRQAHRPQVSWSGLIYRVARTQTMLGRKVHLEEEVEQRKSQEDENPFAQERRLGLSLCLCFGGPGLSFQSPSLSCTILSLGGIWGLGLKDRRTLVLYLVAVEVFRDVHALVNLIV